MKQTILNFSFIAIVTALTTITIGSVVFAADGHDHDVGLNDMSIDINLREDTHDHSNEKQENNHKAHGEHEADGHGENTHESGGNDGHSDHAEGGVELSKAQLIAAGILVDPIKRQSILQTITAPGEVLFNAYKSKKITPRISAQIIKRKKRLGDFVTKGEDLVRLSSVEMAQAQGELIITDREWQRVKKLGKKVVSERRYIESQIARQQAHAKVLAFGMTKSQIKEMLKSKDLSKAAGQFNLLATQNGTVTYDDFIEGEIIEPGRLLFEISDESSMWVEARLTPNVAFNIRTGASANILVNEKEFSATVTQIHHQVDEKTRTIAIRMEVENLNDSLHPGLFVEAQIQSGDEQTVLALPENAVLRSPDGDWAVFVEEEPGHFKAQEIDIISKFGNQVIVSGIEENTRVVTKGAFFVQSEIAKSSFEVHNH